MRVTLLGHASILVEMSGSTCLMDPLFFDPSGNGKVRLCCRDVLCRLLVWGCDFARASRHLSKPGNRRYGLCPARDTLHPSTRCPSYQTFAARGRTIQRLQ